MLAGEILALIAILTGGGLGIRATMAILTAARERRSAREERHTKMNDDLRRALFSRDYRQLDDFLVLWSDEVDASVAQHVKIRRDELYIESNG